MTLDNLLKAGQLKRHTTDHQEIGKLLAAARRNLADARAENISIENRFDAACKCVMQSALAALRHKRNLADYSGAAIDAASLATCTWEARRLLGEVGKWLAATHPELQR